MAIVYRDINNDFTNSYNGSILPYGITCPALNTDEDAVIPCSPRAREQEVRPRLSFTGVIGKIDVDTIHRKSRNEKETAQIF